MPLKCVGDAVDVVSRREWAREFMVGQNQSGQLPVHPWPPSYSLGQPKSPINPPVCQNKTFSFGPKTPLRQ
jgi:hypothetical protein